MWVITNGKLYVGVDKNNTQTTVSTIKKAKLFDAEKTAENFLSCLKHTLQRFGWKVEQVQADEEDTKRNYTVDVDSLNCDRELKEMVRSLVGVNNCLQSLKAKQLEYQQLLNAADGYKIYKMLHGTLKMRRMVKDSLFIIQMFLDGQLNESSRDTLAGIAGMKGRKYSPRIMTDLFVSEV